MSLRQRYEREQGVRNLEYDEETSPKPLMDERAIRHAAERGAAIVRAFGYGMEGSEGIAMHHIAAGLAEDYETIAAAHPKDDSEIVVPFVGLQLDDRTSGDRTASTKFLIQASEILRGEISRHPLMYAKPTEWWERRRPEGDVTTMIGRTGLNFCGLVLRGPRRPNTWWGSQGRGLAQTIRRSDETDLTTATEGPSAVDAVMIALALGSDRDRPPMPDMRLVQFSREASSAGGRRRGPSVRLPVPYLSSHPIVDLDTTKGTNRFFASADQPSLAGPTQEGDHGYYEVIGPRKIVE